MTAVESSHTEYGVNVSNKFAFLDDDNGDPSELLARIQKEKKAKQPKATKPAAPAPTPAAPPKAEPKDNKENRRPPQQNRGPNDRRPGGPRNQQRGNGDKAIDRNGEKPRDFNNRPPRREFNRDGGNRDGNHFRPRRDGPPRNENRPVQNAPNEDGFTNTDEQAVQQDGGERQFKKPRTFQPRDGPRYPNPRRDRVSGSDKTGIRPQTKKQGNGRGNWGNTEDQLAGEVEPVNQSTDETQPKVEGEAQVEGGDENAPVVGEENADPAAEPKEEEAPKMTLDEWKAQHATAKVEFKTRQANEGADQKSLQKFIPLKRDEEEKKAANDEESKKKKAQRSNVVNIELSFNDPNRREYGNRRGGDRDNFRSGGGPGNSRGPLRGGPRVPHGPKLDLSADFPALGAR